jgi:hypothetical protein
MSDWIQANWFELGSLLVQCAILLTLVRYGGKALRMVRVLQTQGESVERLLPSTDAAEPTVHRAYAPARLEGTEDGAGGIAAVWGSLTSWLQAPMERRDAVPSSRVARWLQAPM